MPACKLAECPVAKDGRCLEGRGGDCPNLLREGEVSAPQPVAVEPAGVSKKVKLYSGLPLELPDARALARRNRATVVALVGMIESGKTSLLARLHQLFLAGPIGEYRFAGSRTLWRLEELNWMATVESGVNSPKMPHSSRLYDNSYLHLAVRPHGSEALDLLLNDISGETFEEAIGTQKLCESLAGLSRADHLGLVVDGEALANLALRHDHSAKVKNFLQRVLQSGQVGMRTGVHLIITKLDKLAGNEAVAEKLEQDFTKLFASRVGSLSCWRVAARPTDGSMPTQKEIVHLFTSWMTTSHQYPEVAVTPIERNDWPRDFCRFRHT